jgi:hypothetical protein
VLRAHRGRGKRGSQDSNLESPVLETGAFVQFGHCPSIVEFKSKLSQLIDPIGMRTSVRMRRRSQIDFEEVRALIGAGLSDSEIARLTGIPRSTISAWRHGRGSHYHERLATAHSSWRPNDGAAYCYLLGVYLGDGRLNVAPSGAAATLIVSLDGEYPAVVAEVERAIVRTFTGVLSRRHAVPGSRVAIVCVCHPALPCAFPQHGPGRTSDPSNSPRGNEAHPRAPGLSTPWPNPLRRLPDDQPFPDCAAERPYRRVRVSALLLLQPLS